MFERAPVSLFLRHCRRGSFGGHDAPRAATRGAGRRVERLNRNHMMYIERRYRRPSQDFLAARSMTKKRLSLILIMESSRFVIEKKKTLLSLSTQRPRSRDRRPRRTTATRAPRPLPRRSRKRGPPGRRSRSCWPGGSCAFDPLPETTNQTSESCTVLYAIAAKVIRRRR